MTLHVDYDIGRKCGIIKSDLLPKIREHFSVKDKAARIRKFHNRFAPSKKFAITPAGRFLIGMFGEIYKYAKSTSEQPKITAAPEFLALFQPSYPPLNTPVIQLSKVLRDYQEACVLKCLKQGNGTIVLATAGGKTLIMGSLIRNISSLNQVPNHSTAIIVPGVQLVEQVAKELIDFGIPANTIAKYSGQHEFQPYRAVTIINSQYLVTRDVVPNQLLNSDLLLVDEAQSAKRENKLNKFIKKFTTPHRYGLTGSLPEDRYEKWGVIGTFGPIVYEKSSHDLRQEGYLADIQAVVMRMFYKGMPDYEMASLHDPLVNYEIEREFLINQSFRNDTIARLAEKTEKNTLIIVDRIDHGELLQKRIQQEAKDKKVYFIRGSVELEDREKIRKLMEEVDNVVVVAIAKIFATGIDIKNLHYIFLVSFGKARTRLIQSIGRGLRLHESKVKLYLFDFSDQFKYSISHMKKRIHVYEQERIPFITKDIRE